MNSLAETLKNDGRIGVFFFSEKPIRNKIFLLEKVNPVFPSFGLFTDVGNRLPALL